MKKTKDAKTLLFENMAKLNPDFKSKVLLTEDEKWIQKAVDPEHKGYCTPMTKPTCTPRRKALAKRFKKGIDEATDKGREIIYKFKTDAITETENSRDGKQYSHPVYLIEGNPKYAPIYNGLVLSISDTPGSWYVDTLMEGNARYGNIMYIDFGAKWICSNWSEIMKELNEWISNNENIQNKSVDLQEKTDKWIQKAVDPEHKGYCTPMTKPTCTPRRKALAKRFKKGIEDESVIESVRIFDDPVEFKEKADKIKAVVDKLFDDEDYDILETLYRMMVERKKRPASGVDVPNQVTEDHSLDYQKKVDLLKGKIDFLFDNNHYDMLDKIDNIISQLLPGGEEEVELAQ